MNNDFRLLVFDWDGTLADSEARILEAARGAITELGLPARRDEQIREIIGLGMREAVETLFPGHGETLHHRFVEHYRRHFLGQRAVATALFPGVMRTLQTLKTAGYALAVATGKSRAGLDQELASSGLSGIFEATRCADEALSKPHPRMLEELMEELACEPAETVMIGDTEYDLRMARNAGTHAVAVSYGAHHPERLLQFEPAVLLETIGDLIAWLKRPERTHTES